MDTKIQLVGVWPFYNDDIPWYPIHFRQKNPLFSDYISLVLHYLPLNFHYLPWFFHHLPLMFHYLPWFFHHLPLMFHYIPMTFHGLLTISHCFPMFSHGVFGGVEPSGARLVRPAAPSARCPAAPASRRRSPLRRRRCVGRSSAGCGRGPALWYRVVPRILETTGRFP